MLKYSLVILFLFITACAPLTSNTSNIVSGVTWQLAENRKASLAAINYALEFSVPDDVTQPIQASEVVSFSLNNIDEDLQLDFREDASKLHKLTVNGVKQAIEHHAEHLVIAKGALQIGVNEITIEFEAGESSLNRGDEYLYTLFVPERARTAFPLFDQPNLKATYDLTLKLPDDWTAISAGAISSEALADGRVTFTFDRTKKMSSYLFSFVAGKFERVTRTLNGREMTMLHRESDEEKVARNIDDIFTLHSKSIAWLEDYTKIDFPFNKLDFALIPSFQYGGMEHVGAIQYRASSLFAEENPSPSTLMRRATLIGHEVSHMWFGDLVTMNWFDDVWTKEVFANFIAAKMINPNFPEIDHELNFLLSHYPSAYTVDRSEGSNAIRQSLANLNEAGTLYGNIIYNKAPIMMQQLEKLIGPALFQEGLQEYLEQFSYDNATWPDLVDILDQKSDEDLKSWSETWVNTPGRPTFKIKFTADKRMVLTQEDPSELGRKWAQSFTRARTDMINNEEPMDFNAVETAVSFDGSAEERFLWNANGHGYGLFPSNKDIAYEHWAELNNVQKASLLINLYEQMLEGNSDITPHDLLKLNIWLMGQESNELLVRNIAGRVKGIYWGYLISDERFAMSGKLESLFLKAMRRDDITASQKKSHFRSFVNVVTSNEGLAFLKTIWSKDNVPVGFKLTESDFTSLASILAMRMPKEADAILAEQMARIKSEDRKARFTYMQASLSPDVAVRDAFFRSLRHEENRMIESWVLNALGNLNHPLRLPDAEKYILPSLKLMEEIQKTGDIFFPTRWASRSLSNHRSPKAVGIVRKFLADRPDYNAQLKLKILQAADPLFRRHAISQAH